MENRLDPGTDSREHIALAMERNMVGHMSWVPERLPGASVSRSDRLTLIYSGFRTDTFNVACGAALDADSADAAIAKALAFFERNSAPFSWWVDSGATPTDLGARLIAHGLEHAEDEAGMILDLALLGEQGPSVDGVEIVPVSNSSQACDMADVVAANWTPPDPDVVAYYRQAAPFLLATESPFRMWVAYADTRPVAGCEVYLGEGVAGLYAVVTLDAYRRRGIGTAITVAALLGARAEGYRVATLQASGEGQRIYERLGFTVSGMFREYKPTVSAARSLTK